MSHFPAKKARLVPLGLALLLLSGAAWAASSHTVTVSAPGRARPAARRTTPPRRPPTRPAPRPAPRPRAVNPAPATPTTYDPLRPTNASVISTVRQSNTVYLDAIIGSPNAETLTGLETTFTAAITNPGSITASNANWSMTATITPVRYYWTFGEGMTSRAVSPTVLFNKKGPHTLTLDVTFQVTYTATSLAGSTIPASNFQSATQFTLNTSRVYPVREARAVLR